MSSAADATSSKQSSEGSGGGGDEVAVSSASAGGDSVKSSSEAAATTSGGKQDQNEAIKAAAAVDPAAAAASSSTTTTGGGGLNDNNSTTANRHYPAAAFPQKPSQQQQPHYTQWPMPPHTYAVGRQQAQEDASATEQRAPTDSTASNNEGSGADVKADTSRNSNDNEELVSKKNNEAAKRPQAIYSSNNNNNNAAQPPPPHVPSAAPWGPPHSHPHHQHAHPHHPSHPHHPHHAKYQAYYQQWYRHYAHHHQQQQQQGPHGQPQQHAHHSHHYHWHRQQQQQHPQQQHYPTQMHKSSSNNTEAPPPQKQHSYHPTTIYPSRSNDSTSTTATGIKRNVRELSTVESRDDGNTSTVRMKEEEDNDNSMESLSGTSCTMSLGDFSMTSLGSSSPKGKRRKGGTSSRTPKNKSYDNDDDTNSLELSDKEIMNNLSMNSSYSSDMAAMLYGASPSNSVVNRSTDTMNQSGDNDLDLGKTPKKNNTSSKKPRSWGGGGAASMDEAAFRLDSMTPRFRSSHSDTEDGSSPALLDLIGGAETPTTGLLMTNIENAMMDDISLNRNLRGHAFTPLPHMMGGGDHAALGSGGDASGLSITPQLSWSTNNGSPLEITPRCFGLLDSTKSTNKNPLGSPKSFWKENTTAASSSSDEKKKGSGSGEKPSILSLLSPTMREMEISQDTSMDGSRSTTPLPLNYGKNEQQKGVKKEQGNGGAEFNQKTPVHKHHPGHHGPMMRDHQHPPPPNYHMQASPWAQLGGYMPSPVPGAFPSMSPGFGMYPPMDPNPNDRIRNLRGRGPPVHAIPPSHRLPPPSYHHFSPLTNVMKRPTRPMAYHPPHGNVPPQVDVSSSSKSNCVPMKPPIPSKFQGDMSKYKDVAVPDFNNLVNFPCHMNQKSAPAADGTRNCVMCGHSCPCSMGGKQKGKNNNLHPLADNNQNKGGPGMNNNFAIIPSQNKGLCTLCDVNVWIVVHSGLEIKWCKGCKNFRPWAAFGEKGLATKCVRCRERQREKYAMEKEKKERAKINKNRDSSGRVIATN